MHRKEEKYFCYMKAYANFVWVRVSCIEAVAVQLNNENMDYQSTTAVICVSEIHVPIQKTPHIFDRHTIFLSNTFSFIYVCMCVILWCHVCWMLQCSVFICRVCCATQIIFIYDVLWIGKVSCFHVALCAIRTDNALYVINSKTLHLGFLGSELKKN